MVYISSDVKHQSVKEHLTHDLVKYYKVQGFSIKKIGELILTTTKYIHPNY